MPIDQAEYLLGQLGKLNLETVCEDKGEKFTLIEAEYPTRDLFIEMDDEASEICVLNMTQGKEA